MTLGVLLVMKTHEDEGYICCHKGLQVYHFLVETAKYSVPNIAIPVQKLMVFIAINNIIYKITLCTWETHSDVKGTLCHDDENL